MKALWHLLRAWRMSVLVRNAQREVHRLHSELEFLPTQLVLARKDAATLARIGLHHLERSRQLLKGPP